METKVISARVSKTFFDRLSAVADRLYPKSYTGQPNRTQLIIDALNLFCDLGESGSLDGVNLSQIDTAELVYLVNNPKVRDLEQIKESLSRIESKLNTNSVNLVNKEVIFNSMELINEEERPNTNSVDSVNNESTEVINKENNLDYESVDSVNGQYFIDRDLANIIGADPSTIRKIRQGKRQNSKYLEQLLPYKVIYESWQKRINSQEIVELWTVYKDGKENKNVHSPMEKWQAEKMIEKQEEANSLNPDAGLYDPGKKQIRPYIYNKKDSSKLLDLIGVEIANKNN